VASNVLDRRFEVTEPNTVWWRISRTSPPGGVAVLGAVEDLFSRRVVGWSSSEAMTSRLVVDAVAMALGRRRPGAESLAHSDRGKPVRE